MYSEKQQIQQNLKNHEMDAAADRHDDPVDPSYRTYDEEADYNNMQMGNAESMPLNSPDMQDMNQVHQPPYYEQSPPPRQQTYSPEYQGYSSPSPMPMPQPTPTPVYGQPAHSVPNTYDTNPHQPPYYQ
jgi:hypothetical protein